MPSQKGDREQAKARDEIAELLARRAPPPATPPVTLPMPPPRPAELDMAPGWRGLPMSTNIAMAPPIINDVTDPHAHVRETLRLMRQRAQGPPPNDRVSGDPFGLVAPLEDYLATRKYERP